MTNLDDDDCVQEGFNAELPSLNAKRRRMVCNESHRLYSNHGDHRVHQQSKMIELISRDVAK